MKTVLLQVPDRAGSAMAVAQYLGESAVELDLITGSLVDVVSKTELRSGLVVIGEPALVDRLLALVARGRDAEIREDVLRARGDRA